MIMIMMMIIIITIIIIIIIIIATAVAADRHHMPLLPLHTSARVCPSTSKALARSHSVVKASERPEQRITRHTSHVTRHTSHVTRHRTSRCEPDIPRGEHVQNVTLLNWTQSPKPYCLHH